MKRYSVVWVGAFIVGVAWLWLAMVRPALAHDGGPRLRLMPPQIAPGTSLEVEGINLGTDLLVTVVLEKDGRRQVLGEALCDGHGDFTAFFALPEDLNPGVYTVAVIDHSVTGVETVMASSLVRVGSMGRFNLDSQNWPGYVVWAGAGTLILILLSVPLVRRQRRVAGVIRTRLSARRKV